MAGLTELTKDQYEDIVMGAQRYLENFREYFGADVINYEIVDAVIGCMRSWEGRNGAKFKTMVFAAARNRLINLKKRAYSRRVLQGFDEGLLEAALTNEGEPSYLREQRIEAQEQNFIAGLIEEYLTRLRPERAEILKKIFYEGKTAEEVAEELCIPAGTVRSSVFYMKRQLKESMKKDPRIKEITSTLRA